VIKKKLCQIEKTARKIEKDLIFSSLLKHFNSFNILDSSKDP